MKAAGFAELVATMDAWHQAENTPGAAIAEAFEEVSNATTMLDANIEDWDGYEAMLQNLASLIGAAQRMAAIVIKEVSPERVAAIIEEYQP